MKIMVTSCKRPHACTATVHAPNPAAGHHLSTPPLETPKHPQASLGKSPVESLFLSPGSWCTRFCCALQESISQSCVSSGNSMLGVKGNLFQEGLCHTQVCSTQSLCPCGSPLLTCFSTGDAQTQFCLSLCGVSRSWSLAGMWFDSKHEFTPPTVLLRLLLCPWMWGISSKLLQRCAADAPAPTI